MYKLGTKTCEKVSNKKRELFLACSVKFSHYFCKLHALLLQLQGLTILPTNICCRGRARGVPNVQRWYVVGLLVSWMGYWTGQLVAGPGPLWPKPLYELFFHFLWESQSTTEYSKTTTKSSKTTEKSQKLTQKDAKWLKQDAKQPQTDAKWQRCIVCSSFEFLSV